jgi:hypothetical protein
MTLSPAEDVMLSPVEDVMLSPVEDVMLSPVEDVMLSPVEDIIAEGGHFGRSDPRLATSSSFGDIVLCWGRGRAAATMIRGRLASSIQFPIGY